MNWNEELKTLAHCANLLKENTRIMIKPIPNTGSNVILALAFSLLAGCAHNLKVDDNVVKMIPESAAKSVLKKHLGDWAERPYIDKSCNLVFIEKVPIRWEEITVMTYNPTLKKLYVMQKPPLIVPLIATCTYRKSFELSEDDAEQVSNALRSLGACSDRTSKC